MTDFFTTERALRERATKGPWFEAKDSGSSIESDDPDYTSYIATEIDHGNLNYIVFAVNNLGRVSELLERALDELKEHGGDCAISTMHDIRAELEKLK